MTAETPRLGNGTAPPPDPELGARSAVATAKAISNSIAGLDKRHFGRGPEGVRGQWNGDMLVVCLSGGETPVERTLREGGDERALGDLRRSFQSVMQLRYEAVVRGATGREVAAFMSANHSDPDLRVELFLLGEVLEDPATARDIAAEVVAGTDHLD